MDEPPSPFFQYSYLPSTNKLPSPTNEPPTATDEPPSPLLKSRIPRKTTIVDPNLWESLYIYISLNTIVHLADSKMIPELATFIVLFERESSVIAGTVHYSSTTSFPPENMRLIHMPLIEKVIYNSPCLQATNHCPDTSGAVFRRNFVRSHQRQSDPTIRKVLGRLFTPINPRNPLWSSCWSCSVVFQR
jgi:hypothetical protein